MSDARDPKAARDPKPTGAALRRALIAKLPALEYHGASVLEAVKLDADADLRSALELDAEAFLTPLDRTASSFGDAAGRGHAPAVEQTTRRGGR